MSKRSTTAALRQSVEARASGICEYCRCSAQYAMHTFECEHIVPQSKGGQTILENLAWSCGGCNRFKAARISFPDTQTGNLTPIFNPREHNWKTHFAWSDDFSEVIGMTAIGRATVAAIRLNRIGIVNLRKVLVTVKKHPPF